jgi:hypothetical protein
MLKRPAASTKAYIGVTEKKGRYVAQDGVQYIGCYRTVMEAADAVAEHRGVERKDIVKKQRTSAEEIAKYRGVTFVKHTWKASGQELVAVPLVGQLPCVVVYVAVVGWCGCCCCCCVCVVPDLPNN